MQDTQAGPPKSTDPLGFSARSDEGRVLLALPERTVGGLRLARLELLVPGALPSDALAGPARFQRRRCRVLRAELAVDDEGLANLIRARAPALVEAGFDELRARLTEAGIAITGRARGKNGTAELTATIWPLAERGALRLVA